MSHVPALQPELRALDVLDIVPAGHGAILVPDDAFEPHLHECELAIFDTSDRKPQHGEFYVVEFSSPQMRSGKVKRIVQARRARNITFTDDGSTVAFWMQFCSVPSARLLEGPFRPNHFETKALGRIIGVLSGSDL